MTDPATLAALRAAREAGREDEALALAARIAAAPPGDPDTDLEAARACDAFGRERAALPLYRRALAGGLAPDAAQRAHVGLGSTLRALGRYDEALAALDAGLAAFPGNRALAAFRALTLHNLGRGDAAVGALLGLLAEAPADPWLATYARALRFYAGRPSEVWEG
jgi:tetratricopeptide (TPR) repeat protein